MKYGMTDKEMNERRYAETVLPHVMRKKHLMMDLGIKLQRELREAKKALELADRMMCTCHLDEANARKFRVAFKRIMGRESKA